MAKDKEATIVMSDGREVRIKPVPPLIGDAIKMQIKLPKPPIIPLTVPYGIEEWPNEEDPDYLVALARAQSDRKKKQWDTLFLLGVVDDPSDDGWEGPLEYLGFEIPEDKFARKIFWIRNVVIQTQLDFMNLTESITTMSMVSPEEVEAIGDSFRSVLQGIKAKSKKK